MLISLPPEAEEDTRCHQSDELTSCAISIRQVRSHLHSCLCWALGDHSTAPTHCWLLNLTCPLLMPEGPMHSALPTHPIHLRIGIDAVGLYTVGGLTVHEGQVLVIHLDGDWLAGSDQLWLVVTTLASAPSQSR